MQELRQVLEDFGFEYEPSEGSHYIFRYNKGKLDITFPIPFRRPLKEVYVKKAIKMIDQIIDQEKGNE
jgi:predicted RNA binding protein YcfA (HicA-like mRNA interferase family)